MEAKLKSTVTTPTLGQKESEQRILEIVSRVQTDEGRELKQWIGRYVDKQRIPQHLNELSINLSPRFKALFGGPQSMAMAIDASNQSFAEIPGTSDIGNLIAGTKYPSMSKLVQIAGILHCDVQLVAQRMDINPEDAASFSIRLNKNEQRLHEQLVS